MTPKGGKNTAWSKNTENGWRRAWNDTQLNEVSQDTIKMQGTFFQGKTTVCVKASKGEG